MNNVNEVRLELSKVFNSLKAKKMDYKTAAVLKGTAAVMVSSAKVQVDYQKMIGTKQIIPFLVEPNATT